MTITEFLTARYDEEEAMAVYGREILDSLPPRTPGASYAATMWDYITPERVLADIAAKRRLVELCATWIAEGERHVGGRDAVSITARTQAITAETVLRALVQPLAEHADFDPEWRVG